MCARFDIKEVCPEKDCATAFIPALFGHAENDDFIPPYHSMTLYNMYGGDKNMV